MSGRASEEELEELIGRYLEEKRRDGALDFESFAARYPGRARELLDVLHGMELMDRAAEAFSAEPLRPLAPSSTPAGGARAGAARDGASGDASSSTGDDFVARVLSDLQPRGPARRYPAEGEIARGGQGAVLAVWDETLRRRLAMKVALVSGAQPGARGPSDTRSLGRFLEEALVTAQLDHPGIVPVHELGLDEERRAYFTMKLVKGRDLRAILELVRTGAEGWTRTRALSVLLKVCEAMAYAHAKGVIHRDLKPANVMVGKYGEVYVMDWGLARVGDSEDRKDIRIRPPASAVLSLRHGAGEDQDSPLVTMDGDVVGTPAFMPPEQARGELAAVGPHSDVYAVGAMLYQLLTGEMPYAPRGSRLGNHAVWALVQSGPPQPVHALAPDVPAELVAICEKAMARDVAARYPDMEALAEDVRAYLEQRVVRAYETGALAELKKWVERNRGLAASVAAAIVVALVGLASVGYVKAEGKKTADHERDVARRQRDNVLRLSAFQELEELGRLADELWPPAPENDAACRDWLARARALVAGLEPDPARDDIGHRARLAELEARALPRTDEERAADRRSHPRCGELAPLQARVAGLERATAVRRGEARVEELPIDPASLPGAEELEHWLDWVAGSNPSPATRSGALEKKEAVRAGSLQAASFEPVLNMLSWELAGPEAWAPAGFVRGLALARLGVAAKAHAGSLDTLAWACFANGLDEEAFAASELALELATPGQARVLEDSASRLRAEVDAARSGATLARVREELAELEAELDARRTWRFEKAEELWWRTQLVELIEGIEAFADPVTGAIEGFSPEHGLGVARRLALSAELAERSVNGDEATRRWAEALASLSDRNESPAYDGLVIEPQFGLLPIGRDPGSGLWEFAHLQTGAEAERAADGRLLVEEETGLVFVLIPGGSFLMGAQAGDPAGENYDPQSSGDEGPVHSVTLAPYFLSKYEMTQGQWMRSTGSNPSHAGPHNWDPSWNRSGAMADLTYPLESVSWLECVEICARLDCVLPSEARWEHATRAGTSSVWWPGDELQSLQGVANVADAHARNVAEYWRGFEPALDDGWTWHAPVDSGLPNPFGLHNVHGNVFEWCLDGTAPLFYASCLVAPVADPLAPPAEQAPSMRRIRGGGFWDKAFFARSANRGEKPLDSADFWLGLRPAREIQGNVRQRSGDGHGK